jgi:hypothetical protein
LLVVNAYTQDRWSGQKVLANYEAIRLAFQKIKHQFSGKRIGYPRIVQVWLVGIGTSLPI